MNKLLDKKVTGKILSVLLATMLWLYVITDQNPVIYKDLNAPVKLISTEILTQNGLTILNDDSFNVTFRLKGNKNILDRINENTITVSADLRSIKEKGLIDVPVQVSGIPIGVDMFWTSLNTIKLNIDNVVSKSMAVQVRTMGNPLQGMAAMEPVANPGEVEIKGAESIVDTIEKAIVEIDISSSEGQVKQTLPVIPVDSEGNAVQGVKVNPEHVDIIIPVENTKRIAIEIDEDIRAAQGYVITNIAISPKEIYIAGDMEILNSISKVVTERIELIGIKSYVEKEVGLLLPEGVQLANKNESVVLSVSVEKIIEKSIEINDIELRNVPEGSEVSIQEEKVTVIVRGIESIVEAWDYNKSFYVDLKDAGIGTHSFQILYDDLGQIELIELYPTQVTLTVGLEE